MKTVIIDYGSGNLHSAQKAFERAAASSGVGTEVIVTSQPEQVLNADRIVLPGVGAFPDCRSGLDAIPGMVEALGEAVLGRGKPFLGICVGMQLLATWGREHEPTRGLGWISGEVVPIQPANPALKIPHMGWNMLTPRKTHPLLIGAPVGANGMHAYFVHSFQFKPSDNELIIAETDHGGPITAIVGRDNIVGTQFHPEKSQAFGIALIENFLRWRP